MKISNTVQRRIIVEELKKMKTHPSVEDLFEVVRKRLPKISLGTVYRNLELLSNAGIINKLEVTGHEKRFDGEVSHHYHLRCIRCSAIEDVLDDEVPHLEHELNLRLKGRIHSVKMEFTGLCSKCYESA